MPRVQINASAHGTPGEVVAVEDGQVVWTGPIQDLVEAGGFDALFCHDDDEDRLIDLMTNAEADRIVPEKAPGAA